MPAAIGGNVFTTNPFIPLTDFLSPALMQGYIILMILAVIVGTAFDLLHGKKAKFFFQDAKRSKAAARRQLSAVEMAGIVSRTLATDIATFGEFRSCSRDRRISHVLMFYGFVLYLITTVVMVFGYATSATPTPAVWPVLWNIGVMMILIGGYWFFFFLRVDVAHEGHSRFRLVRADLFIVSLLASVTFALLWEIVQTADDFTATRIAFGLYISFTTLLFVSVPSSKFAHMFYKPAAALQRRVEEANGSSSLPTPAAPNEGR
jgi:hypothetical protein